MAYTLLAKRCFQARAAKAALPAPYTIKKSFDYSKTEPFTNFELCLVDRGENFDKNNNLYHHYQDGEYFVTHSPIDFEKFYGGCYGEFWPAHFGGGYHKFLRRRMNESATYNQSKFPWVNWGRRFLDQRAIHWSHPRGQDYQIILRWAVTAYLAYILIGQYGNWKAHRANGRPMEADVVYPARFNLPFYVYIIHEIPAPGFE